MTIYTSFIVGEDAVQTHTTTNAAEAEELEYRMRADPKIRTQSFGNINGKVYVVVYYRERG